METEKQLTPHESLQIISEMISERKERLNDNGIILRMWAWLVILAVGLSYVIIYLGHPSYLWTPWLLMFVGGAITIVYKRKEKKEKKHRSYLDKISSSLWLTFAINAFFAGFVTSMFWGYFTTPVIMLMLGITATVDGVVHKFKSMSIGGIITISLAWFTLLWVLLLPSKEMTILMNIPALMATNLIPGYILKSQYKKQQSHV